MDTTLPLDIVGLSKHYRATIAMSDVTLKVPPGHIVGLLGPNGVGKSTTMRICAGMTAPTTGTVHIRGIDVAIDPTSAQAHLGYVPDVGGLFPRLSGHEHLELAARLRHLDNWRPAATRLLDHVGLTDAAAQRTSTYSHGMSRRLSLAIALLAEPGLLLLDEPFDGIDPAGGRAVRTLLRDAAKAGAGILLSTHLLDVANQLCDTIVVMRPSGPPVTGTPAELVDQVEDAHTLEDAYLTLQGEK